MKILISADTSCVINYGVLKKNNVSVFPLNVIIDEEEFLDGVTIDQNKLKDDMRANKAIKTSTPPLGLVIEYFENLFALGYDHIIHFTISSKLSSMFNLFSGVALNHFPGKLTIIDSYSLSTGMLNNVLYAKDEVEKGTSIDEIVAQIEKRKHEGTIFFIPENLTALKNGGRISPAIAAIGNTIGLKPVISLVEGELVKTAMTTVVKKAFFDRLNKIISEYPTTEFDYSLVGFDAKEAIFDAIFDNLTKLLNGVEAIKGVIPINVCAHCGPGSIGVCISPKINGKSLKEFL